LAFPFAFILRAATPEIKSQLKIATIRKADTPRATLPIATRRMQRRRRSARKRSISEQDA
jgi:hypothetical protein